MTCGREGVNRKRFITGEVTAGRDRQIKDRVQHMIDYNIISSSSKGNAIVLNKTILLDVGVPFKSLKDVYSDLQLVLCTHQHSDHFNKRTIKRLAQERPTLRFGCCKWLVKDLVDSNVSINNIDVFEFNHVYGYNDRLITPFSLPHNVPNTGYHIFIDSLCSDVFYATDTNSLDHVGKIGESCTLYLIEANYTEQEIKERIKRKEEAGEYVYEYDVIDNHLSKEKADKFLYANMGTDSVYIYLHQHEEKEGTACALSLTMQYTSQRAKNRS